MTERRRLIVISLLRNLPTKRQDANAKFVKWTLKFDKERVRLVEDTALKAAGGKTFAGSIPVLSVSNSTHT